MRAILKTLFKWIFRIEVTGIDNYKNAGERVLIIANHTSPLDILLLGLFLDQDVRFVVSTKVSNRWYLKPFFRFVELFHIEPTNPLALKDVIQSVRDGKRNLIFPEGRITTTGGLMKIYEGPAMIADKAEAAILPIRINGAQYSCFTHMPSKTPRKLFPKISIHILPSTTLNLPEEVQGHERRTKAHAILHRIMTDMLLTTTDLNKTLAQSFIEAVKLHGGNHIILEDVQRKPIGYGEMLTSAFAVGEKIHSHQEQNIGFMLPNMASSVIAFYGLQLYGNVPVMLNYSSGPLHLAGACETAQLKTVLTSRGFIENVGLHASIEAMEKVGVTIRYIEDVMASITGQDKLKAKLARYLPSHHLNKINQRNADDAAVILFTSGSEGMPKGVVLSHKNLQANRTQFSSVLDFNCDDVVFNFLPIFHAFGLTGALLLPILSGVRTFFYPSPLHYRIVPELIYDTRATVVFSTDTFLSGYAKYAHPRDFHYMKFIIAGAEKLRDSTRSTYATRFGVNIFEGYGASEAAPIISVNTPANNKPGSVGQALPGVECELLDVEGLADGKELVVKGPNVMKGYLFHKEPGVLHPTENNSYRTGDIVDVDDNGFITIRGRAKRFAKIAGEMVSLPALEQCIQSFQPDFFHAAAQVADDKKGEAIILFTTQPDLTRKDVIKMISDTNLSELYVPKKIEVVSELPILGAGKINYTQLAQMARDVG